MATLKAMGYSCRWCAAVPHERVHGHGPFELWACELGRTVGGDVRATVLVCFRGQLGRPVVCTPAQAGRHSETPHADTETLAMVVDAVDGIRLVDLPVPERASLGPFPTV